MAFFMPLSIRPWIVSRHLDCHVSFNAGKTHVELQPSSAHQAAAASSLAEMMNSDEIHSRDIYRCWICGCICNLSSSTKVWMNSYRILTRTSWFPSWPSLINLSRTTTQPPTRHSLLDSLAAFWSCQAGRGNGRYDVMTPVANGYYIYT